MADGPFQYTGQTLGDAHFHLHIRPAVFDEVAADLVRALDDFAMPQRKKEEVLAAFNAQKPEVTAGSRTTEGR